jgi:hypothetical protein
MSRTLLSGSNLPTVGRNCLLCTGLNGMASEKMIIYIRTVVRTSNLSNRISLLKFTWEFMDVIPSLDVDNLE